MAKIVEETIVIKVSKLVKEGTSDLTDMVSSDTLAALEQVAEELIGHGAIVEAQLA
jgi:hypothetical protein